MTNRFTVNSPFNTATIILPCPALRERSTTKRAPSGIKAFIMESPLTRIKKVDRGLGTNISCRLISSSIKSCAGDGKPAEILVLIKGILRIGRAERQDLPRIEMVILLNYLAILSKKILPRREDSKKIKKILLPPAGIKKEDFTPN